MNNLEFNNFVELKEEDMLDIDGGNPVVVGVAIGVAVYYGSAIANEYVIRKTGHSIGDHITDAIGKGINTVGKGLDAVGDYLSGGN